MKSIFKYIFILLVAALAFVGCREKWEWSQPLTLDTYEIAGLDVNGGHQYIIVRSTGDWTCHLEAATEDDDISWCRLDRTGGSMTQTIDMEFDKNETSYTRYVNLIVAGQGIVHKVKISQNK